MMEKSAVLSDDKQYRYTLRRRWDIEKPAVVFCLLNPSTADHEQDDPTVRRCKGFAERWGFGGITIVNLFAFRATDPRKLRALAKEGVDVVGPRNDHHIKEAISTGAFVVGWGDQRGKFAQDRIRVVLGMAGQEVCQCMGTTQSGHPRHPLYLHGSTKREKYRFPLWVRRPT